MTNINVEKGSRRRFFVMLFMLLACCITRYTFQIDIPVEVMLVIAVAIVVLGDRDEIVALCIGCIPLYTSFEYGYAVLIGAVVYAIKYGEKLRFNLSVVPILLMVLWEVLHSFNQSFSIVQFVSRMVPLPLLLLLLCSGNERFDYSFICRVFAASIIAMCFSVFGKELFLARFDLLETFSRLHRLGMESDTTQMLLSGAEMNPNALGVMCVLGMTGLFQLSQAKRGTRKDIVLIVLLLLFGTMTLSRTFLVTLGVMVLLLLLGQQGGWARRIKFLMTAGILLVVAVLVLNMLAPSLLRLFSMRFMTGDITTGRVELMEIYHDFIVNNPKIMFFGLGLHDFGIRIEQTLETAFNVPHNSIQEIIVAWGIPGIVLFLSLWFVMIRNSRQVCRRQRMINYIPIIIILVKSLAGQMLSAVYTMMAYNFAYLSMCEDLSPLEEADKAAEPREATGVDLWKLVNAVWRRAIPIAIVVSMSAVIAFGASKLTEKPVYRASTLLYVNNSNISLDDVAKSVTASDIYVSRELVNTYIVILKARQVLQEIIEYAGADLTPEELQGMIHAEPVSETEIFKVEITSPNAREATALANAVAACLPARIASIIDGTSAKVVDYAVIPSQPSTPSKMTNAMLAGIFSAVLMVMIIMIRTIRDTTIRDVEELMRQYSYPVLASVPDLFEGAGKGSYTPYKEKYR